LGPFRRPPNCFAAISVHFPGQYTTDSYIAPQPFAMPGAKSALA
jgi:hypothetical protein